MRELDGKFIRVRTPGASCICTLYAIHHARLLRRGCWLGHNRLLHVRCSTRAPHQRVRELRGVGEPVKYIHEAQKVNACVCVRAHARMCVSVRAFRTGEYSLAQTNLREDNEINVCSICHPRLSWRSSTRSPEWNQLLRILGVGWIWPLECSTWYTRSLTPIRAKRKLYPKSP